MKRSQIEIDKYFNNIKEEIENGHSILSACKKLKLNTKMVYENFSSNQINELNHLKATNNRSTHL
jgi:hypothetical protein